MLVLLIIFMVAAPLSTVDVAVDLPVSTAQAAAQARQAAVPDAQGGSVAGARQRPDARAAQLGQRHRCGRPSSDRQKRIFLRADKTVPYGELMRRDEPAARRRLSQGGAGRPGGREPGAGRGSPRCPSPGPAPSSAGTAAMMFSTDLLEAPRVRVLRWAGAAAVRRGRARGLRRVGADALAGRRGRRRRRQPRGRGDGAGGRSPPPSNSPDVAHGPLMEEAMLTPQAAKETKEEVEKEMPTVEPSPGSRSRSGSADAAARDRQEAGRGKAGGG